MNSYNVYEKLYADTKAAFTIVKNDKNYSLGEYMRMKAGSKNLPAERTQTLTTGIVSKSFSYIREKLSVKTPPSKDRRIGRFPLRTAASSLLSAVIVCSLVLSFSLFTGKNLNTKSPVIVEPETSDVEHQPTANIEGK